MAQILSIHSFRGGTGKSSLVANLADVLAAEGHRVGVVDADLQSPGIHVFFGLSDAEIGQTLNDYLWGTCDVTGMVYDVKERAGRDLAGAIARILREGYDVQLFTRGVRRLAEALELDVLLIDTHPGLNEETLLAMVMAQKLLIVLRPDAQDYEGTAVALQVARELEVPDLALIVNNVPDSLAYTDVKTHVEQIFDCPVLAVLPHYDDVMGLASGGIFALTYPDHPSAAICRDLASALVTVAPAHMLASQAAAA